MKVYNSVTHHLYIVLWVHPPKSSLLPSPFFTCIPSSGSPHPWCPLVITKLLSVPKPPFFKWTMINHVLCKSNCITPSLKSSWDLIPSSLPLINVQVLIMTNKSLPDPNSAFCSSHPLSSVGELDHFSFPNFTGLVDASFFFQLFH